MREDIERLVREYYTEETDTIVNKDKLIKDYENQIMLFQQNYKQLEEKCHKLETQLNSKDNSNYPSNIVSLNEELKNQLKEKDNLLKLRDEEIKRLKSQYETGRTIQQICLDIEKKVNSLITVQKRYPSISYPWQKDNANAKEIDPEDSWWKEARKWQS